ncbi:hypothetical protein [Bradyrhizobium sp. CCGUVB23]|uniref:hypothetical protein n=1 Tax=Bradyrhizobium sp. CCGUVB23 TaxID=2949630 RepID=UPI0020B2D06B|nr:hypothetical protein [Bradyrhizobium sp. CCGUVB23]MCP3468045.1 hypothetical protein [Bradyrhizobium sp. CCGUVB23]
MTRLFHAGSYLPPTNELLTEGGDERIQLDPRGVTNKYGCQPSPDSGLLAFGSATASTISEAGYFAAEQIRSRLLATLHGDNVAEIYLAEISRIRNEFLDLYGLRQVSRVEAIVCRSATDAHMLAAKLVAGSPAAKMLAIMVQSSETGSGVADALTGAMHPQYAAQDASGATGNLRNSIDVEMIAIRTKDCRLRSIATIDDELEAMVSRAVTRYDRILVVLTDLSKTGVLAPSPTRVLDLKRRWPDAIEILVDAAQFRLAASTLQSYLTADCLVVITGSKFVGGPAFSGMLLIPAAAACRLMKHPVNFSLSETSARAEWPQHWPGVRSLDHVSNFGLLLRWEAALAELRAFCAIPDQDVGKVVQSFRDAIGSWLGEACHFDLLEQPGLHRFPSVAGEPWDRMPTIFPFLLFRSDQGAGRKPLPAKEVNKVYMQMRETLVTAEGLPEKSKTLASRCELGQPVLCGELEGTAVAAPRLCLSARLIVEAVAARDRGLNCLIERGLTLLEKAAFLASNMS